MNYVYGILFLLLLLTIWMVRGNARHKRLVGVCETAFGRVYANRSPMPRLRVSYSYGYPAFEVMFGSKQELDAAAEAGLNGSFKQEIETICKGRGPKDRPFNADSAVFFTYEGRLEEQVAKDKQMLAKQGHNV